MLKISKSIKNYLFFLVIFTALFSQVFPDEIPKKESTPPTALEALMQLKEKAVFFHPEIYSKSEWEKTNSLIKDIETKKTGNSNLSEEEFSKLIAGARSMLESCMKTSFDPAKKEWIKSSEVGIEEAEIVFAESLSSSNFEKAKEFQQEAILISSNFSKRKEEIDSEKDSLKSEKLWMSLLEDAYSAFSKWSSSLDYSTKAKAQSLAQSEQLVASITDLDIDLVNAKEYTKDEKDIGKIKEYREKLNLGISLVQEGKIKEGFGIVEKVRIDSSILVNSTISPKVKSDIEAAEEKVKSADENFKKVKTNVDNEEFTDEYKKALETLGAAKEALSFAKDLLKEERYTESINQSEESIRLAFLAEELSITLDKKQKSLPDKKSTSSITKNEIEEESSPTDKTNKNDREETDIASDIDDNPTDDDSDSKTEDEDSNSKDEDDPDSRDEDVSDSRDKDVSDSDEKNQEEENESKNVKKSSNKQKKSIKTKTYRVKKSKPNETLSGIAKKVYGKSSFWKKIYKANKKKIKNPNLIYPNQILSLPQK